MSKNKPDELPAVLEAGPATVLPPVGSVMYLDQRYTSRTLILPGGRAAIVAKGRVTANDDELRNFLSKHSDFKRAE